MLTLDRFEKKIGNDLISSLKRAHAYFFRRQLVWLSDFDGTMTLSVARTITDVNGKNILIAPRFWPHSYIIILHDDGSASSIKSSATATQKPVAEITISWISAQEQERMLMYIKNFEKYSEIDARYNEIMKKSAHYSCQNLQDTTSIA